MALLAHIQVDEGPQEQRRTSRRALRLAVKAKLPGVSGRALIHNLSRTGLLLETGAQLDLGEELELTLPGAGPTLARVVWTREGYYGCAFHQPVSQAAVSASVLQAPFDASADDYSPQQLEARADWIEATASLPQERASYLGANVAMVLLLVPVLLLLIALLKS